MPTSFSSQLQEKLRAASSSHTTPGKLGSEGVNARSQPADAGANPSAPVVGLFIGTRRGMGVDYCGGSIGMKGVMCVVPGGGCSIQSHSLKKASLPDELNSDEKVVLLRSTKQDAVVLNRWWRKSAVDHVLDVVMTDTMSEEEWELTLAQPVATNAECVQLFQERVRSSEFAVTPRKKKQRYADDFVIDQPDEGWVKLSPGKSDESSDGNAFGSNLEVLKRRISEQTADANAFKSTIGSDVDMVEMEIAKLRNLMGARPSGALTLWEEFERMSLEVVSVTASQVSASKQLEESASEAARTVVQEEILSGDVYELLEPGYSFAARNTTVGSKVHGDVLEHRLQALESRSGSSVRTTQPSGSADRVAELERSLASAMTAISELKEITLSHKAELERTQAALATDHVTMNGETFASPLVVSAYVLKHRIAGSVLWFDAVSLCQIASHDVMDHTQALSEHANAKKAGYDNPLTAQIATSFQLTLPSLFGGSSGKSAVELGSSHPLPIFKTYVSWDDNSSTSARFTLETILVTVRDSLNTVITQSECSPQAQLLIRGMLQNSAMFLEKLFQFMQRFYCELTVVHKTDEVESWHLVASLVMQVFLDLAKVRGPARFVNVTVTKDIDVASTFM